MLNRFILLLTILLAFACSTQSVPSATAQATPTVEKQLAEQSARISFGEYNFDPLIEGEPTVRSSVALRNADGYGLFLVQMEGVLSAEQHTQLKQDLIFIQHIPLEAYIVWATESDLANATSRSSMVRWSGEWYSDYRIDANLSIDRPESDVVRMSATFVDDGTLDAVAAQITAAGGQILAQEPYARVAPDIMVVVWEFMLPRRQVDLLRSVPALIFVGDRPEPALFDELSGQIVADNNGNGQTLSAGYKRWLAETGYDGDDVTVAVVDGGVDWDHPELSVVSGNDYNPNYSEANEPGSDNGGHGTHVAGIVAGDGSSGATDASGYLFGLGIAPGVSLHAQNDIVSGSTSSTQNTVKDSYNSDAPISQNSWGLVSSLNPWDGRYDRWAPDYDRYTMDTDPATPQMESLLYVFAAGNDGDNGNVTTNPCPSGNPCTTSVATSAVSKNTLVVGSSDTLRGAGDNAQTNQQLDDITDFSSRGLTQDGRIKPDVVAPGSNIISARNSSGFTSCSRAPVSTLHTFCSGTSMATPQVSGVAALFTEMWRDRMNDAEYRPDPALIKAAIIATTDDIGTGQDGFGNSVGNRPNGNQGWGLVNADRLLNPPVPIVYYENPLVMTTAGQDFTIKVVAADTSEPLRITLVWSDAQAASGANPTRLNDLDLGVVDPNSSVWGANRFGSDGWSVTGGVFELNNNVENVWIENPIAGEYMVNVNAFALRGDAWLPNDGTGSFDQHFSLVCYNCIEKIYVDDSVDDGLVAYYTFDSNSPGDTTYFDSSGEGNHLNSGAFPFSPPTDTPATKFYNPHSAEFDGLPSGYFSTPHSSSLDATDELTIAAWVKVDNAPTSPEVILAKDDTGGNGYVFGVINGSAFGQVENALGTRHVVIGNLPVNVWTYVAFTYVNDGYMLMYINGVETERENVDHPLMTNTSDLTMGAPSWNTAVEQYDGLVDEVRVYTRGLDSAEIARLANGYNCETDGATWHTAHHHLQCGFTTAEQYPTVGEILVAEGMYSPGTNRSASFRNNNIVGRSELSVQGGYAGTYDNYRNIQAYPSVMNGDIDGNDPGNTPTGHNNYHLVQNLAPGFKLSGFTIEHGLGDGASGVNDRGAGVKDVNGGTYSQLIFRNNYVNTNGGGNGIGGGFFTFAANPNIYQSLFVGNRAEQGGGLYSFNASPNIVGSVFSGNLADDSGGAIFITNNNNGIASSIYNTTFNHNHAINDPQSGAMWSQSTDVNIYDAIIWDNNENGTQQVVHAGIGGITLEGSIIEDGWVGAGSNNLSSEPLFVDPNGADDTYGTRDDNLRIRRSSPAVDSGDGNCSAQKYTSTTNLDGDRDGSAECDRGAFEFGTLLLVDDDPNDPDSLRGFTDALDGINVEYDLFDTDNNVQTVPSDYLDGFSRAVWIGGGNNSDNDGPKSAEETAIGNWLDGSVGDCFFISSQDYTDRGLTSFMQSYLGVESFGQDAGGSTVNGSGTVYGTIGTHALTFPTRFLDYVDTIAPNGTASAAFTDGSNSVGIHKQMSNYVTTFLGFPLELMPLAAREATLTAFLDDCAATVVPTAVAVGSQQVTVNSGLGSATLALVGLMLMTFIAVRRRDDDLFGE